jgi:metacaspase-1
MANKAFLVGVNIYEMPGSNLSGCVNDATNVRDILLKYFGFSVKDIRVLVDGRATKKAIMERLEWLVKDARAGDRLLFHFSGHGSQIRDRDGDELNDHLDEILCPHDMDWDGTYIVDDELKAVFDGIPAGVHLEVLLDSCHSGTGTREAAAFALLPPEHAFKSRFLVPPVDILCRQTGEDDLPVTRMLRTGNPTSHVLFAGCRDNQTSADALIGGAYNGAFTYYLCKHLRDTQGGITRADLLKSLRASLKHEGYDQVPQLECPSPAKKKKLLE